MIEASVAPIANNASPLTDATCQQIRETQAAGKRVIAVGTTSVRYAEYRLEPITKSGRQLFVSDEWLYCGPLNDQNWENNHAYAVLWQLFLRRNSLHVHR